LQTSPSGSISLSGVWKRFHADETRPVLAAHLSRARTRLAGREAAHWRWVLRDVSLDVRPGEAVGLIGTNGSGKSTLLKLLTRVMYPYAGELEVAGRVGALIEVDAGLHPELTGRENIFLYGSLCGIPDAEMRELFDSIVEFAALETAIDRQVKYYSTGMRMRLGFTVAVATEPDVLLVDEVLAVGDSTFQAKCLTRIRNSIGRGTTVVLVSHDLLAVQAVCTRAVWLHGGVVMADGPTEETLAAYRLHIERQAEADAVRGTVRYGAGTIAAVDGGPPRTHAPARVSLELEAAGPQSARVYMGVSQGTSVPIFTLRREVEVAAGTTRLECTIEDFPLAQGQYYLWLDVLQDDGTLLMEWQPVLRFEVAGPALHGAPAGIIRLAPIHVESDWEA
jgi:ABC-2 type transport system ATP-binding protein